MSEPDANGEDGTRLKAWGPGQARGAHVENMPPMAATACTGLDSRLGARAGAQRTMNMAYMVVTLEVLKLSGWLKAHADCRVEGKACDAGGRGASREAGGPVVWWRHDKRHARGKGPTQGLGAKGTRGAHVEHTCRSWS